MRWCLGRGKRNNLCSSICTQKSKIPWIKKTTTSWKTEFVHLLEQNSIFRPSYATLKNRSMQLPDNSMYKRSGNCRLQEALTDFRLDRHIHFNRNRTAARFSASLPCTLASVSTDWRTEVICCLLQHFIRKHTFDSIVFKKYSIIGKFQ